MVLNSQQNPESRCCSLRLQCPEMALCTGCDIIQAAQLKKVDQVPVGSQGHLKIKIPDARPELDCLAFLIRAKWIFHLIKKTWYLGTQKVSLSSHTP